MGQAEGPRPMPRLPGEYKGKGGKVAAQVVEEDSVGLLGGDDGADRTVVHGRPGEGGAAATLRGVEV